MRITPLDIRKQEFKKVMRGLDSEEVYAFLNTIAEEYEAVLSDNKNLRERLVALEERLNEYKAIETNLRNTLLTAEKLTQEAKENARREASLMIREAEMEADKAAESIRAHTSQLRREILELKKNKDNYITRLKTLLDSHKKMLDGFEEDFAGVDQAIEKIGQQVEADVRKTAAPPRMSRDKITEEFGQAPQSPQTPKDKVTWGDERRREDEPRPQMPRPGFETRETPNQRTKAPEDTNIFAAPRAEQLHIEPLGATVEDA
ncbi:MAG: DivIVA domain-containing protein, partial [Candidatus Krumholzibacteriaceae bacterium]